MNKELLFRYVYKNIENGSILIERFTIEDIERMSETFLKHRKTYFTLIARNRFTGLKDKLKVEIYEGDIISYNKSDWLIQYGIKSNIGSAGYYAVSLENAETFYCFSSVMKNIKVVGNIYEGRRK